MVNAQIAPELNTSFTEPLHLLEQRFISKRKIIEDWFDAQWEVSPPPVYGSVDLRNAGFKLAPIDMNLFPAGFNNLNPDFMVHAEQAAKKIITRLVPHAKKILVLPESHTRNVFYWQNIKTLEHILIRAGFDVRFGLLNGDFTQEQEIKLPDDSSLTVSPLIRSNNKLMLKNFSPDLILLNNDLSSGIPEILQGLQQPLLPPAELGWSERLKSEHFHYYAEVTKEFSTLIDIDPWLIDPLFRHCGKIDFLQQEGLECVIHHAEILFQEIQKKYDEYGLPHQPFLIVKADAGTYGMAVMTVRHVDELKSLNRKQRTRMANTKGGQPVDKVIIQEGVYTFETVGEGHAVAEPVVYLWGNQVIGGFYRVHKDRGVDENLNAPGMQFEPIAFSAPCHEPTHDIEPHGCLNRYYLYGIVAQLSMLAAAREMKDPGRK